jgi:hypothetical protein
MSTTTPLRPPRQRKPLLPVLVLGRFLGGASDEDLDAGAAVLEIEDADGTLTSYWCRAIRDRGGVVGYRLTRFLADGGEVYDVSAEGAPTCCCPDATFRPQRPGPYKHGSNCKHVVALMQALRSRAAR